MGTKHLRRCSASSVTAAAAAKLLQSCPTLCDPIDSRQPNRLPHPWDSPGKNTGVGCHFLLQCMKVKSESEVIQSCLTLRDPMDCSPPGSSVHGTLQARVLEWGAIAFSIIDYTKAFDCVDHNKLENFSRDGNTRPPYLPPVKSVCRSRSNSEKH